MNKSLKEILSSSFILSVSGWRSIFASDGNENSLSENIPSSHAWIMIAAGISLGEFFKKETPRPIKIKIALGRDTRPTGKRIEESLLRGLLTHSNIEIEYLGISAITEIMAYTSRNEDIDGFIYVSASHNPVGYNGLKIGLSEGGCLNEKKSNELINLFLNTVNSPEITNTLHRADKKTQISHKILEIFKQTKPKKEALISYEEMAKEIVLSTSPLVKENILAGIKEKTLGIVGEMNGSSRFASIDPTFFKSLFLKTDWYNTELGKFSHGIVPEGKNLDLCQKLLLEKNKKDPDFIIGYVPDCDGDRGNIVYFNEEMREVFPLEAQEGFALVVLAELSFHLYQKEKEDIQDKKPIAVIVNDATSLRIEEICKVFSASVFRAEVGEANVVSLADKKTEEGWHVIILGEGSNGGSIIPPSRVRDPIYTISSLVKLLSINDIYKNWFSLSKIEVPKKKTIFSILKTLPNYVTTNAFEEKALVKLEIKDQAKLKKKFISLFNKHHKMLQEWLPDFSLWKIISYEGTKTILDEPFEKENASGGLKILILNSEEKILGSIWVRKSKTEPVFRILIDLKNGTKNQEESIREWIKALLVQSS